MGYLLAMLMRITFIIGLSRGGNQIVKRQLEPLADSAPGQGGTGLRSGRGIDDHPGDYPNPLSPFGRSAK